MIGGERKTGARLIPTVNGPGEISGWLAPLVRRLREGMPALRICPAILPYVFSSGKEAAVLKSMIGRGDILDIRDARKLALLGAKPDFLKGETPGCVLHLGGEPFLSRRIARRLGYPLLFYGESLPAKPQWYQGIFLAYPPERRERMDGLPAECIGNLMVDAVLGGWHREPRAEGGRLRLGLFPGSRFFQVKQALPFMMEMVRLCDAELGHPEWFVAKADYLDLEDYGRAAAEEKGRHYGGDSARLIQGGKGEGSRLRTDYGLSLSLLPSGRVLSRIDLALCLPGTTSAELAVCGIPFMMLLSSDRIEKYPLPGPAGYAQRIPFLGPWLKRKLLLAYRRRHPYFAYPNLRAGRAIVPEFIGRLTTADMAENLVKLAKGPRERIGRELQEAMGPPGAADRLAAKIREILASSQGDFR